VDIRQYVLMPSMNKDSVTRVWLDEGQTETWWR
jgi:hypothetical protein